MPQGSQGFRRGSVFAIRVTDEERRAIDERAAAAAWRSSGRWLVHAALSSGTTAAGALPGPGATGPGRVVPAPAGVVPHRAGIAPAPPVILDLCGGSGAWSAPYAAAGYDVRVITLPEFDVRHYRAGGVVHGVLAAPPCTEFSIAKTTSPRDLAAGLETVCACLRIIAEARPAWWALENPGSGLLRRWLGEPRDVWQPSDFGDPWTKLTAIWGDFVLPARSPVQALTGMPGANAAERAITPPGFARAFFEANP